MLPRSAGRAGERTGEGRLQPALPGRGKRCFLAFSAHKAAAERENGDFAPVCAKGEAKFQKIKYFFPILVILHKKIVQSALKFTKAIATLLGNGYNETIHRIFMIWVRPG